MHSSQFSLRVAACNPNAQSFTRLQGIVITISIAPDLVTVEISESYVESAASSAESANTALEGSFHPTSRGTAVRVNGRALAYGLEIFRKAAHTAPQGDFRRAAHTAPQGERRSLERSEDWVYV